MKNILKTFFILILSSIFFLSCEIGLGASVDTEAPQLEIQNPSPDAIIRGAFKIGGIWSDDGTIETVTVKLSRTDGKGSEIEYQANFAESNDDSPNTWNCIINPQDSANTVLDGNYIAQVDITDGGKHTTTKTVQFAIDNTAPVIVLQRPSTKDDAQQLDSYGQKFTLEGQAADDNNVSLIEVQIFADKECTTLLHTVPLSNVPNSINLDVAEFKENIETDYSKIYGSTQKMGQKNFYCEVVAYDGAVYYPYDRTQTPEDLKGNKTNIYYLYEDIATAVLGEVKITDVYHILSGVYGLEKNSTRSAETNSLITKVKSTLEKNVVKTGSFSLNPANNPTFSVSGKEPLKKDEKGNVNFAGGNYDITNGSQVILEVTPGLDNIPLDGNSLKVYCIECDEKGTAKSDATKIYPTTEVKKSGTTYKYTLSVKKQDGLVIGRNYLFGVEGYDEKKNSVVCSDNNGYGFHFTTSGAAPGLTILEPEAGSVTLAKGKKLKISGTTKVEAGTPVITIIDNKEVKKTLTFNESEATEDNDKQLIYDFSTEIEFAGESAYHELEIISDIEGIKTTRTKTVSYDCDAPVININAVSPIVETVVNTQTKKCLNGEVKITFSLTDDFSFIDTTTNKPYFELWQENQKKYTATFTSTNSAVTETVTVNTKQLKDKTPLEIKVFAWDRAGNKSELSDKQYQIDQSTDKPVITPKSNINFNLKTEEAIKNAGTNENKISVGGTASFTVTDDDSIDYIAVYSQTKDASGKITETLYNRYPNSGSSKETQTPYSFILPSTSGYYSYRLEVKDIITTNADENNKQEYQFMIKATAPAPTIELQSEEVVSENNTDHNDGYIGVGGSFTNTITIESIESPFKLLEKKVTDKGSVDYTDVTEGTTFEETGNGKYKFTRTVSPTITTTYYYKVEDSNGQSSNEKSVKCKVDNSAPELGTITLPGKADTRTNQFTFRSTAKDPDSGIKIVEMYFSNDGQNYVGPISAEGTENWYYILNFNQPVEALKDIFAINYGEKYVKIKATDKVGLSKETEPQKFFYDTADPTVTIKSYALNGADNTYTQGELKVGDTSFSLKGTVSDDWKLKNIKITQQKDDADPVEIYSSVINDKEKEWEIKDLPRGADKINAAKESGKYKYVITAIDYAENQTDVSISVTQDITKPVIKIDTLGDFIKTSTLVISGTVEDTSTTKTAVYLLKDGTTEFNKTEGLLLGTDNRFSWTVYEVPDGKYKIKVISEDDFGNKAEETGTEFTVDVTAPTTTLTAGASTVYNKEGTAVTTLDNGSTYYVKGDYALNGTIDETNLKSIKVGEKPLTVNNGNTWNKQIRPTSETVTTQTITLEDKAGNKTVYTLYIAKDESAPLLTVTSPTKGLNAASFKVEGQVTDLGIGVASVSYELYKVEGENETKVGETKTQNNVAGSFKFPQDENTYINLTSEGNYTIKVTAIDKLNNTTAATEIKIVNDSTPPTISSATIQNSYIRNDYTVGTGESAVTYTVYGTDTFYIEVTATDLISDVNTVTAESGTTKVELTAETDSKGKETGKYKGQITAKLDNNNVTVITIKATDKSNNLISQDITNIMVDKTAPELTITSSIPQITKDSFTVSGTVSEDIALDSSPVSVAVKGPSSIEATEIELSDSEVSGDNKDIKNWNFAVSTDGLIDGTYTFTIEVTDKATNTKKYEFEVLIDKTPPTINKINLPTAQDTKATSFGFTGTASDAGSGVEKIRLTISDGTETQDEEAVGTINWICQVTYGSEKWKQIFSTEGIKTVTITATDKAGNDKTTEKKTFTYDTANPTIEIDKSFFREFMPKEGLTVPVTVKDSYKLKKLYVEQYFNGQLESTKEYTYNNEDEKTENVEIPFDKNGQKKEPTDGKYTYIFKVTDDVGNVTETTFGPVKYDDTKPEITILNPSDKTGENAIDSTSYKFEGKVEEENLFGIYYKIAKEDETSPTAPSYENQDGWTQVSVSGSGTSWNFYQSFCKGDETETEGTLKEGSYTVYLYAIDKAANVSEQLKMNFDVDLAAPTLTSALTSTHITDTNASIVYFNGNLQLSGTVKDTNGLAKNPIKIEKGGKTYTVTKTDDNYSAEISESEFTESTNETITITATDIVGKKTTKTYTVRLDKTPPTIEVISPTNGENISSATKQLRGTVSDSHSGVDASKVTYKLIRKCNSNNNNFIEEEVSSGTIKLTGESFNITDFKLFKGNENANSAKEGTFTLKIDAEDKLGNKAIQSQVEFYYDKAAPELSIEEITSPTKSDIKIAGKCWDSNEIESVTIYVDNIEEKISFEKNARPITKPENNNIDKTYSLKDGEHIIKIVAKDISGNEKQEIQTIIVDKKRPTITVDTLPSETYKENENKWYNKTTLSLTGKLNDSNGEVKTSGIKSVQYKLNNSESMVDVSFSSVKWNATVMGLQEGLNTVTLEVTDNAGNKSSAITSFYVDSKAPETLKVVKIDSLETSEDNSITSEYEKLTNKKNEIKLVLEASDVNSGEGTSTGLNDNAIEITKIGSTVVSIKSSKNLEDKFVITIPVYSINDGTVKAVVTDKAGNKSNEFELFIIKLDNKYPTVKINTPSDASAKKTGTQVNKTITLSGTATDNNELDPNSVKLQYSDDGGSTWKDLTEVDQNAKVTVTNSEWTAKFDTTKFSNTTETKKIKLRGVATDKAGNVGNSGGNNEDATNAYSDGNAIEIEIDQDTDRPIITITNLQINKDMAINNPIGFQDKTIYGLITDDDGTIKELYYSIDNKSNWTTIKLSNSSFNFVLEDGSKTVFFKIKDANDKEFVTKSTSSLESPKLEGFTNDSEDSPLYLKIDTTNPAVDSVRFKNAATPQWSTAISSQRFGGDSSHAKFTLEQSAADVNGIKSVTFEIPFVDGDKGEEGDILHKAKVTSGSSEDTPRSDGLTYTSFSHEFDVTDFTTGTRQVIVTVSDGIRETISKISLNIDNSAPSITVDSHASNEQIRSSFLLKGMINEGDVGTKVEILPTDSQNEPTSEEWKNAKELKGSTAMTWRAYFDGDTSNQDEYTHLGIPKDLFIDLYGTSKDIEKDASGAIVYKNSTTKYTTIEPFYFHFRVTDSLGNSNDKDCFVLKVDPQGDIPVINLLSPTETETTQSGTIRFSGSAEDDKTIVGLYIEIDPQYNGSSFEPWSSNHKSPDETDITDGQWWQEKYKDNPYEFINSRVSQSNQKTTNTKAIFIGTSLSWNIALNKYGELNGKKVNESDPSVPNNKVAVRFYAVDVDGNTSEPTEPFIFDVDSDAPKIGSSVPFYLYQYNDDNTVKASVEYTDGMWLKGKWYLVGSVEDESGISTLTINSNDITNTNTNTSSSTPKTWTNGEKSTSGYLVKYEIGNNSPDAAGTIEYKLDSTDIEGKVSTRTFNIKYDNKAPVLAQPTDEFYKISKKVQNENGFYTIKSSVNEGDSGFERVVFYFKRTTEGYHYVYDSYLGKNEIGNKHAYDDSMNGISKSFTQDNTGLYWVSSSISKISGGTVTIKAENVNAHTGGIAKIGETIYRIKKADGTTITLEGNPSTEFVGKDIFFAIGHVVDHSGAESAGSKGNKKNGYYTDSPDDDGDNMIETVSTTGNRTIWSGSVNSRNVPDGEIEIHYVAFDKAGNTAHGVVTSNSGNQDGVTVTDYDSQKPVSIANNAPRLAGVRVWTDYNGNGEEDSGEWETKFYKEKTYMIGGVYVKKSKEVTDTLIVSSNGNDYDSNSVSKFMTIRDYTKFYPELVGGNGNLYYSYKIGTKEEFNEKSGYKIEGYENVSGNSTTLGIGKDQGEDFMESDQEDSEYVDSYETSKGIPFTTDNFGTGTGKISNNGLYWFEYVIYDSTEGCKTWDATQTGTTGRLSATMRIALDVDYFDETVPNANILPFFWKGKSPSENSIAWDNGKALGHIELESDLTDDIKNTTVNDKSLGGDPKVSGKIIVRGTASDNIRLKELYAKFDTHSGLKNYTKISEYKDSIWTEGIGDGWSCKITEDNASTDGHDIKWELTVDTSFIEKTADLDKAITVFAVDARGTDTTTIDDNQITGNTSHSNIGNTQTKAEVPTAYYQMDIVPYITGVKTSLSDLDSNNPSCYNRTALGHYAVNATETVDIYGFNLAGGTLSDSASASVSLGTAKENSSENAYGLSGAQYFSVSASTLKSGKIQIKVNNIPTLNNINESDAKGDYSNTDAKYENHYNRTPNGLNNNLLEDDIIFDVWEFDSNAATPISGQVRQPIMKISPATGMIQFAFANGPLYFSMGGGNYLQDTTSHDFWSQSYDFFTSIGYTVDDLGYTYGVCAGGDINAGSADVFALHSSRFHNPACNRQQHGNMANPSGLGLEQIAQKGDKNKNGGNIFLKERIMSPSLGTTVSVNDTSTNLYLAYIDNINSEIRFKSGTTTEQNSNNSLTTETNGKYPLDRTQEFGMFKDKYKNNYDMAPREYDKTDVNIVANSNSAEYLSLGVVPSSVANNSSKDVVVLVWYEGTTLKYAYNETPLQSGTVGVNNVKTSVGTWTVENGPFGSGIGKYCKVAVDKTGGIHVAAYDQMKGDLKYAYRSGYKSGTWQTCTVDSYGIIGSEISLEVAMDGSGNPIPYISYYADSAVRPKLAYLENSGTVSDGATNDFFTKNWEVSYLPTSSIVPKDHINVGLWKNAENGQIVDSMIAGSNGDNSFTNWQNKFGTNKDKGLKTKSEESGRNQNNTDHSSYCYGYKFANGTKNPMVAYQVGSGVSSTIETAQMK